MNGRPSHLSRKRRPRVARGMTLLEVVLAVIMLSLVTASISGALAFTLRQERRNDLRLGAYEIANRLVLQYLDDETIVEGMRGKPLAYGANEYDWEMTVDKVAMRIKDPDPGSGRPKAQYKDRFEFVTFRVWLHADSATGRAAAAIEGPEPLASLSRLLDPGFGRNPDAMKRLGADPARMMGLVGRMGIIQGSSTPSNTPGSNQNRGNTRPGNGNGRSGK